MKQLPPFASIRAFEAAARHSSFKEAAVELGLTPAAVSHQIKQLEERVDRQLFVRRVRKVSLTPQGRDLQEAVAPALTALSDAFAQLTADGARSSVTLGAGPIFASRWLVPRLGELWSAHPSIDLWLHHSRLPVWQQMDQFDLAVAWGTGKWRGLDCTALLRIRVSPVLAPAALRGAGELHSPSDCLQLPLLHHRDDKGWRQWLEAAGVSAPRQLPGAVFDDANVLLQATLAGRGVSLGILGFIADELSAGRLVQPFPLSVDPVDAYYLVGRQGPINDRAVSYVREWLLAAGLDGS